MNFLQAKHNEMQSCTYFYATMIIIINSVLLKRTFNKASKLLAGSHALGHVSGGVLAGSHALGHVSGG